MANKVILDRQRNTILGHAIEKAQKNGFMPEWEFKVTDDMGWTMRKKPEQTPGGLTANITYMQSENDIVFSHDFARALWGEGGKSLGQATPWKLHLANMVIADDPIKYLGENL